MKTLLLILLTLLFIISVPAQAQEDCPTLIDTAITTAAESCQNLDDNTLCFGYGAVSLFVDCENFPEFDTSGDTVPLDAVCMMRVQQDIDAGQASIAMMHIQPEHTVGNATVVMMGAGELHNASSGTFEIEAWMKEDSILRSGPGSHFSEVRPVVTDETLQVHACNCTQNWVRAMLEDGQIGWLPSRTLSLIGDADTLPVIDRDAPFFDKMQAFTLQSAPSECGELPGGVLIQSHNTDRAWLPMQINDVEFLIDATLFVDSVIDAPMHITVLEGEARVMAHDQTYTLPAGTRLTLPREEGVLPTVAMYTADEVANLPLALLPDAVDPLATVENVAPIIVSIPDCFIISNVEDNACPVIFVNPDGDAITEMNVEFVYAPEGEWESRVYDAPELLNGDMSGGTIAWKASCTLGKRCFIGKIEWEITLTDENGHSSEPYPASFNCVDG